MRLEKNNNSHIIFRIAKSNLAGKKVYSFFSFLTILLAMSFVSTMVLYLISAQTRQRRILDNMQHVIFMNVTEEQMDAIEADPRTEMLVAYKHTMEFESGGVKFSLNYMDSHGEKIATYVPAEGSTPQAYQEIVVDRRFMEALGKECALGAELSLNLKGREQIFTVCGYTESGYESAVYPVYVSKEFSDNSPEMEDVPYDAPVRILDAPEMAYTEFEQVMYRMGKDYGIPRVDINANGKFEESLQNRNAGLYAILMASVGIMAACAVVIYSIFYLSVTNRVQQLGQLQTIGMTQRQIKKMIRREGYLLSGLAIPLGIVPGGAIAYFLRPDGWSFGNFLMVFVGAGLFGLLTVQLSIGKPAAIAAAVSPIEASRSSGKADGKEKAEPHRRLTPVMLAVMGQRQDRGKWWLMTASLAFGGIVLMVGAGYVSSWDPDGFSRQSDFKNAEFVITYLYDAHTNPKPYGLTDLQMSGQLGEELEEKLLQLPHVESMERVEAVFANIGTGENTFQAEIYPVSEEEEAYFGTVTEGDNTYSYLAEQEGLLVLNTDFVEELYGISLKAGEKVMLNWFDGGEHTKEIEIAGTSEKAMPGDSERTLLIADAVMRKLWGDMNTTVKFLISAEDYQKNGEQVERDIRTALNDYPDLALYTLREQKIDDAQQIRQLNTQVYGIAAFIIMFSILNLINTLISNISTRQKELAMLESIGMEAGQIRQMLLWESIFLALPNLLITFTVGTAAGYAVVTGLKSIADYMDYHFPFLAAGIYAVGMILIPMLISALCLKTQNRTALVERIKNTD